MSEELIHPNVIDLATELTIAWLSNPNTRASADEVPEFLRAMHVAVLGLSENKEKTEHGEAEIELVPAVSVRKSLASRQHIISLIDGKPYKALRRHLRTNGMTPEDYRKHYGLRADYPMVAPAYAEKRSELAKKIGLGRKAKPSAADADGAQQEKSTTKRTRRGSEKAS